MGSVSDKGCREQENTNFMFVTFLFESRAICEIMSKSVIEAVTIQLTVYHL